MSFIEDFQSTIVVQILLWPKEKLDRTRPGKRDGQLSEGKYGSGKIFVLAGLC
jgi:hypothetical protein